MALISHDTLLIYSEEDAAFLICSSYVTNPKLANYLQRNAGISHSSAQATRARRNVLWGRRQCKQGRLIPT